VEHGEFRRVLIGSESITFNSDSADLDGFIELLREKGVEVQTTLAAPQDLALTPVNKGFCLTWTGVASADAYTLLRSDAHPEPALPADWLHETGDAFHVDSPVREELTYFYAVAARTAAGQVGDRSRVVAARRGGKPAPPFADDDPPPDPPSGSGSGAGGGGGGYYFTPQHIPGGWRGATPKAVSWGEIDIVELGIPKLDPVDMVSFRGHLIAGLAAPTTGSLFTPAIDAVREVGSLGITLDASQVQGMYADPSSARQLYSLAGDLNGFGIDLNVRLAT
jgi:hypothetical protein